MRPRKIIVEIITIFFIILWAYAAMSKLLDYSQFRFQLGRSPYIQNMAIIVSIALPAGELIMAALLVFKKSRLIGMYLSFFTMALFTGYIYSMLNFSYYLPCSCGGILSSMDWGQHLIFNIVFTVVAGLAVLLMVKDDALDHKVRPPLQVKTA